MQAHTVYSYKFNELSEEARQKAIENLYDLNIDYEWWESVYEDAAQVGITITAFDTDRGSYCNLDIDYLTDAAKLIIENHGEHCETHKDATRFMKEIENLEEDSEEYEEAEAEFKHYLAGDYLSMLRREFEYLTSEEAIKECIEANEYDFTEDGKLY